MPNRANARHRRADNSSIDAFAASTISGSTTWYVSPLVVIVASPAVSTLRSQSTPVAYGSAEVETRPSPDPPQPAWHTSSRSGARCAG